MEKKQKFADKENSTYWWKIFFDKQGAHWIEREFKGEENKEILIGYSKFKGDAEARDKISALTSKIEMLSARYLDHATKIEIYKKQGRTISEKTDTNILTLFRNDCKAPENIVLKMPSELKYFLEDLYKQRKSEAPFVSIRKELFKVDKTFSKDMLFDINKIVLRSMLELKSYCDKQISNGEAYDLVLSFYKNYASKHLLR